MASIWCSVFLCILIHGKRWNKPQLDYESVVLQYYLEYYEYYLSLFFFNKNS